MIFSEIWREEEFGERRSFYTLVLVTKTSSCFCAPIWQSNSYSIKARGPIWEEEEEEEEGVEEEPLSRFFSRPARAPLLVFFTFLEGIERWVHM